MNINFGYKGKILISNFKKQEKYKDILKLINPFILFFLFILNFYLQFKTSFSKQKTNKQQI